MLHKIELPVKARWLRRIVAMQRLLLKATCQPATNAATVSTAWVQSLWGNVCSDCVQKFCEGEKGRVLERLQIIASAPIADRRAIYNAFVMENRTRKLFHSTGQLRGIAPWKVSSPALADAVQDLLEAFYDPALYQKGKWLGFEFIRNGQRESFCKDDFIADFESINKVTVCPYCDGSRLMPKLDHFYPKSTFPFLACAPHNLIPICTDCNNAPAKGFKVPLTPTDGVPTLGWLHPHFRPAAGGYEIEFSGSPPEPVPKLHSTDALTQTRLDNASNLVALRMRWQRKSRSIFAGLRKILMANAGGDLVKATELLENQRTDHASQQGDEEFAMLKEAVCKAALAGRAGFMEELLQQDQAAAGN